MDAIDLGDRVDTFSLTVSLLNSTSFILSVQGETAVGSVKAQIEEQHAIPAAIQRLILEGDVLEDERSLASYNITCDTEITLAQLNLRLLQVQVRSGDLIDQITFTYSDGTEDVIGKKGGNLNAPFVLEEDEYLVSISGRKGDSLDAVQFHTNLGRASPLYGKRGGKPFTMEASPGRQIWSVETDSRFCGRITSLVEKPLPNRTLH
eukprot:TRINITY_DN34139_c0_g1_i1.p1 TRINITY_DN34139_c0_g1~~TRINITY_DN34139_c0_g1_i1.p1  ORF type:complete len:206 (-),score=35.75 TRINITY_DN34139_c0_g1_i1:54-671(-)